MIELCFRPLQYNSEVFIYDTCEPGDMASEFLPTSPTRNLIWQGEANFLNDKAKKAKRSEGTTDENIERVVDIYPEDHLGLKSRLRVGAQVVLKTTPYGSEDGYLEGVQYFDSNLIKLCICLKKQ